MLSDHTTDKGCMWKEYTCCYWSVEQWTNIIRKTVYHATKCV